MAPSITTNGDCAHHPAQSNGSTPKPTRKATKHPLDALNAQEIDAVSFAVRKHVTEKLNEVKAVKFAYITLIEPVKLDVLRYLGIATTPEEIGNIQPDLTVHIPRQAETSFIDAVQGAAYLVKVTLDDQLAVTIDSVVKLPEGVQPGITNEELIQAELTVRNDPRVIKLCEEVGVKQDQIVADGWSIGWDQRFGKGKRLQQCFLYARYTPDSNYYAHPLDFNVVVDSNAEKVVHIDFATHRNKEGKLSSAGNSTHPSEADVDSLTYSGRERIPPPTTVYDYLPDLLGKADGGHKPREDIKPLQVVQPEGVSFTMDGNQLTWQNWSLHVGWSYRDGVVLNTITYNDQGRVRPVIYRASLAEFVVPYGAPEWPHPRKMALDIGEYGLGMMANELSLGCDCLGSIHYLDGVVSGHDGRAITIKSAVCIHEEDAGLLWKHTDFRTGGRVHAVRSRKLVISFIVTVANYEYAFYYNFFQDGTIQLEIKLTGILQIYTLAEGEDPAGFGTEVAPRVLAHHHQHLFSFRVDPMIDGIKNSVVETEVLPVDAPTGSAENYGGNGFKTSKTTFKTSKEAVRDADSGRSRIWSMVNPNSLHYATKGPVGFKALCQDMPPLLCKPDSFTGVRTPFAKHNLWAVKYAPERLYPAGKFVTQTIKAPEDSVSHWADEDAKIDNEDIVLFFTWGTTHVPRAEDFPVMPVQHLSFTLKPVNFFKYNPALDVPQVKDKCSVNAFANGQVSSVSTNGTNGVNGVH